MTVNFPAHDRATGDGDMFRKLFENSPAIEYLLDPANGRIVDANSAACKFWGWSREQLQRMCIWDINIAGQKTLEEQFAQSRA